MTAVELRGKALGFALQIEHCAGAHLYLVLRRLRAQTAQEFFAGEALCAPGQIAAQRNQCSTAAAVVDDNDAAPIAGKIDGRRQSSRPAAHYEAIPRLGNIALVLHVAY